MFRLLKLMRILRLSRKMAKVDFSRRLNPSIVRLIKLLGKIVFAGHLLGCTWFMVDECDVDGGDDMWPKCGGESLGSKVRERDKFLYPRASIIDWGKMLLLWIGAERISKDNAQSIICVLDETVRNWKHRPRGIKARL